MPLISPRVPRDSTGVVTNATVLLPVAGGRRAELDEAFVGLNDDQGSLFRRVPSVHTARLEVLDSLPAASTHAATVPVDPPHLLFGMTFDGRFADVVATMCTQIGPALAAVWRCAAGCPNIDDVGAVTQWLQHHRVPAALPFSTRAASVHDIRAAVAARDRLRAFVVRAQSMTNAELFAAFRQEIG